MGDAGDIAADHDVGNSLFLNGGCVFVAGFVNGSQDFWVEAEFSECDFWSVFN